MAPKACILAILVLAVTGSTATQTMDAKIRDDSDLSQVRVFRVSFPGDSGVGL